MGIRQNVHDSANKKTEKSHCSHSSHKNKEEVNINIRAAVVHVIGDMLQSIGVIIAAILIYIFPKAVICDPICTYIFSIIVLCTTVPVFKDCMRVLMEACPIDIDLQKIRNKIYEIKEV